MPSFGPVLLPLLTMLAAWCVLVWARFERRPAPAAGRFDGIDGLRGYLAFFVFLHHAAIWSDYAGTGLWSAPASQLYTQLGESSVSLFFMITSFLFFNKLLQSRDKPFDWTAFFVGRLFRLTPLYVVAMCAMFAIVAIQSNGELLDTTRHLAKSLLQWLGFSIAGMPDINGIEARRIVAGVTWSLPYEWVFYLALPLLGLAIGSRVRWPLIASAVASLLVAAHLEMKFHMVLVFAGGILAALLVRQPDFIRFARRRAASGVCALALAATTVFPTGYDILPLLLLTTAFCLIASGTDLFGLLTLAASRHLGELAYSMYLLHGLLLYGAFDMLIGRAMVASWAPWQFWTAVAVMVPVLIALCTLSFRWIEDTGNAAGRAVLAWHKRERHGMVLSN